VTARIAYAVNEGLRRRTELAIAAQEQVMAEEAMEEDEEVEEAETLVEVDPEALALAMSGNREPTQQAAIPDSTEGTV
jgi:hypothetical protein